MAILDEIQAAVRSALPPGVSEGIEQNLRAALSGVLERLDLVTREEWDVQRAVLARTREKLEQLEQLVVQLEQRLPKGPDGSGHAPR